MSHKIQINNHKIPSLIKKSGKEAVYHYELNSKKQYKLLFDKLQEEMDELKKARTQKEKIEELADVITVVNAFVSRLSLKQQLKLSKVYDDKLCERGAFYDYIVLDEVKDNGK